MMKCPDCEQEVSQLVQGKRCKRCSRRLNNAKYQKKEYVPLKEIKGTSEYLRAMSRREGNKEEKIKVESKKKEKEPTEEYEKIKEKIQNEIEKRMKQVGVEQNLLNVPISIMIESFITLFRDNNYLVARKKMMNEYDVLISNRLHQLIETEEIEDLNRIAIEQKIIQDKREPNKKELYLFQPFEKIIRNLSQNQDFMEELIESVEEYEKRKKEIENPKYITNEELENENMIYKNELVKRKISDKKRYAVEITCTGLYGNKQKSKFIPKGGIYAENENEAKKRAKRILEQYFSNVEYDDSDIVVKGEIK